jgi:hypothetical protein
VRIRPTEAIPAPARPATTITRPTGPSAGTACGAPGSDRASQKSLGIRLFDTAGREIDRAPIPLGPAVPERVLRESSPAELDAFQARRAGRIASVGTRWVPFEAVVTDLPRFAGRFELQALDR